MAYIARFRAVITTDKGEASRLSPGIVAATVNDRAHGFTIHAAPLDPRDRKDARNAWTLSIAPVANIGSAGATFHGAIARLRIEPDDLAKLHAGTHRLAIVEA